MIVLYIRDRKFKILQNGNRGYRSYDTTESIAFTSYPQKRTTLLNKTVQKGGKERKRRTL
jgi:hypothetical protein